MVHTHMTGNNCRGARTGIDEAARNFLAWLAADANPALTGIIQTWLQLPAGCRGPGGPPVSAWSAWEVARLRAEVLAAWQQPPQSTQAPGGRAAR